MCTQVNICHMRSLGVRESSLPNKTADHPTSDKQVIYRVHEFREDSTASLLEHLLSSTV